MNSIMYDGKKSIAEAIVYGAFDSIERKAPRRAAAAVQAGARERRAGRSRCARGVSVAPLIRCLLRSAWSVVRRWRSAGSSPRPRARNDKTMVDRLSAELLDAANNRGNAVKKRGRHAPDGGSQPRLLALPLVTHSERRPRASHEDFFHGPRSQDRRLPQLRNHGPHRCGQDDDDRADSLLFRQVA